MRILLVAVTLVLTVAPCSPAQKNSEPNPDMLRPIAARDTIWIEKLTWLEVGDAIRGGKTIAIVPTGGIAGSLRHHGFRHIVFIGDSGGNGDYQYESIVAIVDSRHIRLDERKKAGLASTYGVSVEPIETTIANGKKLIEYRAALTAAAITKAVAQP